MERRQRIPSIPYAIFKEQKANRQSCDTRSHFQPARCRIVGKISGLAGHHRLGDGEIGHGLSRVNWFLAVLCQPEAANGPFRAG